MALYIKNDIDYIDRDDIYSKHNIESCWIEIKHKHNKNILIGTIYRPPSENLEYFGKMVDLLSMLSTESKDLVLLGDLNINCLDKTKIKSVESIETMFDMKQLISAPTRQAIRATKDGNVTYASSLIDLIFTTVPNSHYNTCVVKTSISDHYLVKTKIRFSKIINHKTITFRDYKNFNDMAFKSDLVKFLDKENTLKLTDVEKVWTHFKEKFTDVSNCHAPLITRRLKPRKCPWMTTEIVKTIHERDYYHRLFWKKKNQIYKAEYKKRRNLVTSLIRNTKRKYYEDNINNNMGNPNMLWKTFNDLLGSKQKQMESTIFTASQFNAHFCAVGTTIADSFIGQDKTFPWKSPASIYTFSFKQITPNDVESLLKVLPNNSSLDILNFDHKLLKIACGEISTILAHIFNLSIKENTVCGDWKIARVTPAYKGKGTKGDMNNYRPISSIPHIAKLMERLINKQLVDYLTEHDLISADQSAYRAKHSTVTALHRVMEDWLDALNESQQIGVIFLDTKKCFDSIDHDILLNKMKHYGIVDNESKWFMSYLSGRKQKVFMNNKYSEEGTLKSGVPQGSILGPTLFLLFINDLSQYGLKSTINIYSDDVLIYFASNDITELTCTLQESLDSISHWYTRNRLLLNATKCGTMVISNKLHPDKMTLHLDNVFLDQVDSFVYLGVTIDPQLNFNFHCLKKVAQIKSKLSLLRRLSSFLSKECLSKMYKTMMLPSLEYAFTVWGQTSANNIEIIMKQEKLAARIICKNFDYIDTRGEDLCIELGWLHFNDRLKYAISCTMFKMIHGQLPDYLSNQIIYQFEVHGYQTRGAINNDLYLQFPKVEKFKQSLYYNGATIWNGLDNTLRDSVTLKAFKRQYRALYFN